jgi:hypothetical protein
MRFPRDQYRTGRQAHHLLGDTAQEMDFSESSNQTLDYTITFASKRQACPTVLYVVELSSLGSTGMTTVPEAYIEDLKMEADRTVQSYLARITAVGLTGEVKSSCTEGIDQNLHDYPNQ